MKANPPVFPVWPGLDMSTRIQRSAKASREATKQMPTVKAAKRMSAIMASQARLALASK